MVSDSTSRYPLSKLTGLCSSPLCRSQARPRTTRQRFRPEGESPWRHGSLLSQPCKSLKLVIFLLSRTGSLSLWWFDHESRHPSQVEVSAVPGRPSVLRFRDEGGARQDSSPFPCGKRDLDADEPYRFQRGARNLSSPTQQPAADRRDVSAKACLAAARWQPFAHPQSKPSRQPLLNRFISVITKSALLVSHLQRK